MIEGKNDPGSTALCEATSLHYEAIIALLLEEGANVNQRNNEGISAIHFAVESKMSESTVWAILARQLSSSDITQCPVDKAEMRREQVVLEMDSDWARFYLDFPPAVIEMPEHATGNITCAYHKVICITRPSDASAKFYYSKVEFTKDRKIYRQVKEHFYKNLSWKNG